MKNQLLVILITFLSTLSYSQISFEKGYYITNNGEKVECEIKNIDWKNNPLEFEFRLSENTEKNKKTIKLVKEFGIYNYSKYIKRTVNIDRSSKNINNLSTTINPVFKEEELFLKVLVNGQSNLYQYEDGNLVRFFYSIDNSNNIEQLIFKNYKSSGNLIRVNNRFKQQLLVSLKCEHIKIKDLKKISYEKDDLVKLFVLYNQCGNSELVNFEEKQKKDLFNLTIRPRINNSSLAIANISTYDKDANFGNITGFGFGMEAEFILSFNKSKWAILLEPTYQYYKSEIELTTVNAKVDYKSIELPIGIRYYFFLNSNSKFFINGSYIIDIPNNSKINYNSSSNLEISNSTNLGLGIGYKHNDKYSLELRYKTNRDLLRNYNLWRSEYKTISVIFGYSIF
ncbi:outer membrane beta-barrel protein [Lutibacter citreus]|uniref:outer membrane beta-barrel protein n=1 Tax=Lutibacter citreus TaxID=2138210 RepID=UPI000DBE50F9|nr:outer membrane beta-barrel protein [Lutibacter citreus]